MSITRSPLFDTLTQAEKNMLGDESVLVSKAAIRRKQPSDQARAVKAKIGAALSGLVPNFDHLQQAIKDAESLDRARMRDPFSSNAEQRVQNQTLPPPPEFQGLHYRWLQTAIWGGHGFRVENDGGPEAAVTGISDEVGDDRVVFIVGMESYFLITSHDLVMFASQSPAQISGSPVVSVHGTVYGYTGYPFIMSYGDKWAKCRLKMSHDVRQITSGAPGAPFIIKGSAQETIILIDEENKGNSVGNYIDLVNYWLPPFRYSVDTSIANVFARVEIALEIELEGVADISFIEPVTQKEHPFLMATWEWSPYVW